MKKFLNINGTFLLPDDFTGNKAEALQIEMLEYKDRRLPFEQRDENAAQNILRQGLRELGMAI